MQRGDVIAERFEIERLTATGGTSEIYRARDRATGETVAVKCLVGRERARFDLEARVLAQLDHPAVVRYVANGETPRGEAWLAMEWLDGEPLSTRLGRGPLRVEETVAFGLAVAEALGAAHRRGIVHRDIKPENLLLVDGAPARVKLLDFGIVRVGRLPRDTRAGMVLGTLGYMPPEQARGTFSIDARADVYSLGCVLHECLSGAPVFAGDDLLALLAKIVVDEVPRAGARRPGVPEALDELLARMVQKDPALRPRDGAAVAAVLSAIAESEGATPSRPSARRPELTQDERRTALVVLVGRGPAEAAPIEVLRAAVEARRGQLEALADGSLLALLPGSGVAEDRAAQAAECAMALRTLLPGRPMALAFGRGEAPAGRPAGEAIDRAARLLRVLRRLPEAQRPAAGIAVDDVAAALLSLRFEIVEGPAGLAIEGPRAAGTGAPAARTLLGKPTPCLGRDREIEALLATFERSAGEPRAEAVLITAPAGFGKTRLSRELLPHLEGRAQIWMGRGDPSSAGSSFSVLAAALRHAAGLEGGDPLPLRQEKLRERVARHVAEPARARVAAFLGEIVGTPFPDDAAPELASARRDAVMMGDLMRRAWVDLVRAECAWTNVVLVLDDLHWGDLPTLRLVGAALAELPRRPLLVIGLGRPEVHELFPKLWAPHDVTELRLGGLAPGAGLALVRAVLGDRVDDAAAARLVEQADGHPLFLEELIRAAAEGAGDALPETVLAMVETRLDRLAPEARRALRAASVFGDVFWSGGVQALLGDAAPGVPELAALVAEELVVRRAGARFAGEDELEFRSAFVREAAYATLTDTDRHLGHQLAGEWLERAGETDAMVLAAHFEAGEDPTRAVAWYRRAAEQAFEGSDLEAVLARAARGVACGADGEALGALSLFRAEAQRWRGHPEEAERHGAEAMARLAPSGPLWFAAAREVILTADGERLDEAVARVRELRRDEGLAAAQLGALAAAHARTLAAGRGAEADEILATIEAFAELGAARDPAAAAAIHDARAERALFAGDAAERIRSLTAARAGFERAGDRRSAVARRVEIGRIRALVGDHEEAERSLRAAHAEALELGLAPLAATARRCAALALGRLGELDGARAAATDAAAGFAALGGAAARQGEGAARAELSTILLLLGAEEAPEREARRAVDLTAGARDLQAPALAALGEILLGERRFDEARAAARAALALSSAPLTGAEMRARLVEIEALAAAGEPSTARAALGAAGDRLLAGAAAISDPALRAVYLERVPENARILELLRLAGIAARVAPSSTGALRRAPPSVGPQSEAATGLRDAEMALRRGNPDAAIARVEKGMNHVATSDVRAELRAVMARAHGARNAWTTARRWAEQGMREAVPGSRGWYASFAARLSAARELGERAEIVGAADALPRLGGAEGAASAVVAALASLAIGLAPLGEGERTADCFDRMERAGAPLAAHDPVVRGWMCRARAERARSIEEDPWTALRLDEAAREAFAEAGDSGEAAFSLALVGVSGWQLGAYERAERAFRAALEAGGHRGYLGALTTVYLAWTLADAGRLADAGNELLAGLKVERSRHNPSLRAAQSAVLADVLLRRGEPSGAEREAEAVLAEPGAGPLLHTCALAILAATRLLRRRPVEALDLARRARHERETRRLFGFRDTFVRLTHIEALLANGDVGGARTPLSRAYARLLVHSSKIGDPALRVSFLERVPENARTLALARQWLGDVGDHAFR